MSGAREVDARTRDARRRSSLARDTGWCCGTPPVSNGLEPRRAAPTADAGACDEVHRAMRCAEIRLRSVLLSSSVNRHWRRSIVALRRSSERPGNLGGGGRALLPGRDRTVTAWTEPVLTSSRRKRDGRISARSQASADDDGAPGLGDGNTRMIRAACRQAEFQFYGH